ncbi:MAG: hemerythrin domain-containing protein [Alphaproteobacteria bacterium]|jgi:hemerythrin-like metal-binding protein|nr:hemerythrin domain-containing protein [Alphaproteobacteria bacterium]MDP6517600.1 hemerythrin domain-containing protein [Alphaproteobacteria bacterium]
MVELTPSFKVGNDRIDDDHRHLLDIINHIVETLDAPEPADCASMVSDFVALAKTHFEREEAFMKTVDYPDMAELHDQHQALYDKLDTMVHLSTNARDNKLARESLRREMVYFLMDDVINEDLNFKQFLADKGLVRDA